MPKQPYLSYPQLGFSLIELSIVIVIVGILVGGIAGFQSYMRNAEVTNMLTESQVFITAFNQFQTRYKAPPGDFINANNVWTGAFPGDGNGIIRACSGVCTQQPLERYYVFQHLARAGFIPGTYTGAVTPVTNGATIGLNVPATAMQKTTFLFDHPDAADGFVTGDALYFDGTYGNILRIAGLNGNATDIPDRPFISGARALQIDDKIDDGQPGKGNILTPKSSALVNCASSDIAYITTSDEITCYLFIKIQ